MPHPFEFTDRVAVDGPPTAVWEVLGTGYGRLDEWFAPARSCVLDTEGPIGPGTVRVVGAGPVKVRETIETWEPKTRLAYSIAGIPGVDDVRSHWVLSSEGDDGDGTRVELTVSGVRRDGVVGALLGRVGVRQLGLSAGMLVTGLRRAVDGDDTAS